MGGGGLMESGSSRWSRVGDGVTCMSWPTCQAAANTYPNPADHHSRPSMPGNLPLHGGG